MDSRYNDDNIELKYYSKFLRTLYVCFNIILVVSFFVLSFIYSIFLQQTDAERIVAIIILLIFALFAILNAIIIKIRFSAKSKFQKEIKRCLAENKYDDAIEYVREFCKKKNAYSVNQMIIFYLGYLELLKDNVAHALYYLTQFDLKRQKAPNSYYLSYTIVLLYLIYYYTNDEASLRCIAGVFNAKRESLLKVTKSNYDINDMFKAVNCFCSGNPTDGALCLKRCRIEKIPFVNDIITRYGEVSIYE